MAAKFKEALSNFKILTFEVQEEGDHQAISEQLLVVEKHSDISKENRKIYKD